LINKLVFENLRYRPIRTLLGMIAIGVEVTMMLTLAGVSRGMLNDYARRTKGIGADIVLRPPGSSIFSFSAASMPDKLLPFLRGQAHVTIATGVAAQPVSSEMLTAITGVDLPAFNQMTGGLDYVAGGPFQRPGDAIIDQYYAQQHKLNVGDKIVLLNRDWRVSGIVEPGKFIRIAIPLAVLQDLTGNEGKLSQIFLKVDNPANIQPVIASLKSQMQGYQIYSMEQLLSMVSVNNVPGLKPFIGVVIGLAVVVGFLIVFLSMYTAVLERTREIGILKALGASPAYVLNVILRETVLLGIAGTILGILFSFGTRLLIARLASGLTQEIVPDWWPIAAAIALAGALLGAAYPGWRAARQDPIEALAYE
jgi:putative ABC transport system permease protein